MKFGIDRLIAEPDRCSAMGNEARSTALKTSRPSVRAAELVETLSQIRAHLDRKPALPEGAAAGSMPLIDEDALLYRLYEPPRSGLSKLGYVLRSAGVDRTVDLRRIRELPVAVAADQADIQRHDVVWLVQHAPGRRDVRFRQDWQVAPDD